MKFLGFGLVLLVHWLCFGGPMNYWNRGLTGDFECCFVWCHLMLTDYYLFLLYGEILSFVTV